jgi:hypothetical protein
MEVELELAEDVELAAIAKSEGKVSIYTTKQQKNRTEKKKT